MTFPDYVRQELTRARALHPRPIHSLHEAYAVILEEVDEWWTEVKKKSKDRDMVALHEELVQIGAMIQRTAEDVVLPLLEGDRAKAAGAIQPPPNGGAVTLPYLGGLMTSIEKYPRLFRDPGNPTEAYYQP